MSFSVLEVGQQAVTLQGSAQGGEARSRVREVSGTLAGRRREEAAICGLAPAAAGFSNAPGQATQNILSAWCSCPAFPSLASASRAFL